MEWKENKIFKEKYIVIGNWNFDTLKYFPHCDYLSADTETKIYYNNELLTEQKAYEIYNEKGAKFCRMNFEVKPYAFMLSDGENFALFQNAEDFLLCCATMLVKKVFWYNARFDFCIFDYYFATNGWKETSETIKEKKQYGKLGDKNFQSLNGDYGQRYQMRIWKSYKSRNCKINVHNFKMLDICNIFGGGLRKNLIDWNIEDKTGSKVRKLTMDYVNASIENDLEYMIADTKGLHLLAQKINETLENISGYSLFNGDFITAGGLAKKSFLQHLFGSKNLKFNTEEFHKYFPMSVGEDKYYREHKLYQGGKCLVNPYKIGKVQYKIYKYDENSMYPDKMRNMYYPLGNPKIYKFDFEFKENKLYVLLINKIKGKMKKNMIPVWYDTIDGEYKENIFEPEQRFIWKEELDILKEYYDLEYNIIKTFEFDKVRPKGAIKYVDLFYDLKKNSKGAVKLGAKLFLNSAYGKLAQRIERVSCKYELSEDGYMHLVKGKEEIDEKNMLSVLVGSRITALARVDLMKNIILMTNGNPRENFIYCDTDSVHTLCYFADTDDKELGKFKNEGTYEYGIYLAPKTYLLYNNLDDENEKNKFEIHSKGVNTEVVRKEIEKCKNLKEVKAKFHSGVKYKCLNSLNVKGGKALVYVDKYLLDPKRDRTIDDDEKFEFIGE